MSEPGKRDVYVKAGLAVAVLLVVWWILRRSRTVVNEGDSVVIEGNKFTAPYMTTNPGIPDVRPDGTTTFNSVNNITVQTMGGNGLSNSYMPLFGLVGMTAIKG